MSTTGSEKDSEGIRLIGLALALQRNPAYATGTKPAGEIPQGMEFLLRVANGNDGSLALAMRETGARKEELKQAAIRFIEQVSFGSGDDPYRVLGVNPWALPEEVKSHYRLLIRLFHPDRSIIDHVAAEKYSARINQSYTAIRGQPPAEFTDHSVRHSHSPAAASVKAKRSGVHSAPVRFGSPLASPLRLDSLPVRLTPQRIWGAIAVTAALFVGAVYLANQRPAPGPAGTAMMPPPESAPLKTPALRAGAVTEGSKLDRLLAGLAGPIAFEPAPPQPAASPGQQSASRPAAGRGDDAGSWQRAQAAPKPAARPAMSPAMPPQTATKVDTGRSMAAPPSATDPPPRNPRSGSLSKEPTALAVADAIAPDPAQGSAQKAPLAEKSPAVAAPSAGSPLPAMGTPEHQAPTDDELHSVVAEFIGSYNQGDLDDFMALIADNIRTDEPGGKEGLRQVYGRLFSNSATREMLLKNLHWQRAGSLAVGQTDYHVTVSRPGQREPKVYTGTLSIEVANLDGRSLISGFYNLPDRK